MNINLEFSILTMLSFLMHEEGITVHIRFYIYSLVVLVCLIEVLNTSCYICSKYYVFWEFLSMMFSIFTDNYTGKLSEHFLNYEITHIQNSMWNKNKYSYNYLPDQNTEPWQHPFLVPFAIITLFTPKWTTWTSWFISWYIHHLQVHLYIIILPIFWTL